MRCAVLADVHANLPALSAVLDEALTEGVCAIIVAGDMVGAGPYPNEVVRLLRSLRCHLIRGNTDTYPIQMADGLLPQGVMTSRQWAFTRWTYRRLEPEVLTFFRTLPEQRVVALEGADSIRVTHGSIYGISTGIDPVHAPEMLDRVAADLEEPVMVCGHTHEPWMEQRGGKLMLNPGSVSASNDGDWRAHYAMLTWGGNCWEVEHRRVEYDLDAVRAAFLSSGLFEQGGILARLSLVNIETGRDVVGDFMKYVRKMALHAGHTDRRIVPEHIWRQAEVRWLRDLQVAA